MSEQRRFARVAFREPLQYHVWDKTRISSSSQAGEFTEDFGGCLGVDLSVGGLRFRRGDFLPLNCQVEMAFVLPGFRAVRVLGRTVWVQKIPHAQDYWVGVAFLPVEENRGAVQKIETAVRQVKERPRERRKS